MGRRQHFFAANRCFFAVVGLLAVAIAVFPARPALALIEGGEGNDPITDPGWPKGAERVFNYPARVAYWVGPPFGGGQWHGEFRGNVATLNAVLADFAKIDAKHKRVVVHSGFGRSFWLNPNREKAKEDAAKIDWTFMVWQPASWERLKKLPPDLRPAAEGETEPPVQIDIYTGNLKYAEVEIPKELKVTDDRMEAHGFMPSDGVVLEGTATDLATGLPLAAKMRLELIEPQPKGGYKYATKGEATADAKGRWVLRKAPAGWFRVIVEAEGYVPKVVGHAQFDEEPRWTSYESGLAKAVSVSGTVTMNGKPLADVQVRLADVTASAGAGKPAGEKGAGEKPVDEKAVGEKLAGGRGRKPNAGARYESPSEYSTTTDATGHFELTQVPEGTARVWLHKPGFVRPGLGETITTPKKDVSLSMIESARMVVTIDFGDKERPEGYIVHVAPEGGEVIGSWGGSGNIDAKNQITFENVPPGKYILYGMPNPGSEKDKTEPFTADLKGGKSQEIKLKAK